MLERLIYNNYDPDKEMFGTKEDIYLGQVDIKNRRELLRIHDTSGEEWTRLACPPRHLCHYGDAFLLTYDITSEDSFTQVKRIKAEIEKELNKASNIHIAVAAMKTDLEAQRAVDIRVAESWALRERIKHFNVSVMNRGELAEPLVYLASKLAAPPQKSGFLSRNKGNDDSS